MQIFLIKNSDIDKLNTIKHVNDFQIVLDYLTEKTNYNNTDMENITSTNGSNIKFNSFNEVFNIDSVNGTYNLEDLNNFNGAVIKNYPFYKNYNDGLSYWWISKIEYLNNLSVKIFFTLDAVTTFSIGVIDIKKVVNIDRKHKNYVNEISPNGEMSKDSFFRMLQSTPDFDSIVEYHPRFFTYDNEENQLALARSQYWFVFTVEKEFLTNNPSSGTPTILKMTERINNYHTYEQYFRSNYNYFVLLGTNKIAQDYIFDYIDPPPDPPPDPPEDPETYIQTVNFADLFYSLIADPKLIEIKVFDFPPFKEMYTNNEGQVHGYYKFWDHNHYFQGIKPERLENTWSVKLYPQADKKLFTFEAPSLLDDFKKEHILELQFEPFKSFELGFTNEPMNTGFQFSNNDKIELKNDKICRIPNLGTGSYGWTDILEENYNKKDVGETKDTVYSSLYGNKTKRSIVFPTVSSKWNEYNEQKKYRSFTDFGKPIAGVAKTAALIAIPGGVAVKGAALVTKVGKSASGLFGTMAKRKSIKNTPDTVSGSSDDILTEMLSNFNSKCLKVKKYNENAENAIALEFHKYGAKFFNMPFMLDSVNALFVKQRFNFIKLSNLDIKKEYNFDLSNYLIDLLVDGITFWEFPNANTNVTNEIFSYKKANPDV